MAELLTVALRDAAAVRTVQGREEIKCGVVPDLV